MKLAHGLLGGYIDQDHRGMTSRFTAIVSWDNGNKEEIDVDAGSRTHAWQITLAALKQDYLKGGQVRHIIGPRVGRYL